MLTHLWNVYGYTWLYNLTLCKWFNRQFWLIQVMGVWYQIVDFFWQTKKRKNMFYFRKCMTHPCKRTWMGSRRQYICSAVFVARLSFFTDPFECWLKPNPPPPPPPPYYTFLTGKPSGLLSWHCVGKRTSVCVIQNTEAETKWPPFCRRDWQIHFHEKETHTCVSRPQWVKATLSIWVKILHMGL